MTDDDVRLCSVIAWWMSHNNGDITPCDCLQVALDRNAALKQPHSAEAITRIWPLAQQARDNAKALNERMQQIAALVKQGKPVPLELDCRLCDLPGLVRPEDA